MECFTVQVSDIDGRIDSESYRPDKIEFFRKLKKSSNIIPLKEVMIENAYGVLPPGDCYSENNDLLFLRATELKPDLKIDFASCLKIPEKYYRHVRARIKKNDILIAVKGATIASNKSVVIVKEDIKCIINGSIFRFQTNESANPQYIAYILDSELSKKQMRFNLVANNAVDYLNKSILENILIPLPSLEVQNQIVELMDEAHQNKKEKEQEAKDLLDSVNDYVLKELGIEVPEIEDKKCFVVNSDDIKNNRVDVYYNQPKFLDISSNLKKINSELLGDVATFQYGLGEVAQDTGNLVYIRITDIDEFGNLKKENLKYLNNNFNFRNYILNKNDLLIARTGATFGKSYLFEEKFEAVFAGYLIRIHINDFNELNPRFLFCFMQTKLYWLQARKLMTGGGQPQFNANTIEKLRIPLPSIKIQNKIASEIKNRINKAEILKKNAMTEIDAAKLNVEKIILGE